MITFVMIVLLYSKKYLNYSLPKFPHPTLNLKIHLMNLFCSVLHDIFSIEFCYRAMLSHKCIKVNMMTIMRNQERMAFLK
jgi:hypothetical protein